ncbi:laminin B domain-containing protein [Tundrisphaera sp. TA3]|uniref:laminin B domain-containing protein n=1 Tax=Tundrisphaera sp. TA3 TaxID=3435775 RepID=UPI003EBC04A6
MQRLRIAAIFLGTLALCEAPAAAAFIASSTFDTGDDGWTLAGDSTSAVPTYVATGGNPGGFLRGFDETVGGTWYWDAPGKFLGDISAAYGQALTFDLRQRGDGTLFDEPDIILRNGALRLVYDTTVNPRPNIWTTYSVLLTESSGWRIGTLDGAIATRSQFLAVLSGVDRLRIRGEFIDGPDSGDLDNVILGSAAVPEPSSLSLWGVAAATGLLFARRRGGRSPAA